MSDYDKTVFVNVDKGIPEDLMPGNQTSGAEPELAKLYQKLGQAYYEGGFEDPIPELIPLFDQITSLKNKKPEPKVSFCPQCGAQLASTAKFCGKCGCRL